MTRKFLVSMIFGCQGEPGNCWPAHTTLTSKTPTSVGEYDTFQVPGFAPASIVAFDILSGPSICKYFIFLRRKFTISSLKQGLYI